MERGNESHTSQLSLLISLDFILVWGLFCSVLISIQMAGLLGFFSMITILSALSGKDQNKRDLEKETKKLDTRSGP